MLWYEIRTIIMEKKTFLTMKPNHKTPVQNVQNVRNKNKIKSPMEKFLSQKTLSIIGILVH